MSLAERFPPHTRAAAPPSAITHCTEHGSEINTRLAAEFLIPLNIRESGGVSEAFGKRVAVNLQFGYLQ